MSNNLALDREEVVESLIRKGMKREEIKFTCDTCDSLFHCHKAYDPLNVVKGFCAVEDK